MKVLEINKNRYINCFPFCLKSLNNTIADTIKKRKLILQSKVLQSKTNSSFYVSNKSKQISSLEIKQTAKLFLVYATPQNQNQLKYSRIVIITISSQSKLKKFNINLLLHHNFILGKTFLKIFATQFFRIMVVFMK